MLYMLLNIHKVQNVWEYCHYARKYWVAEYNVCYIHYRTLSGIPVIIYDCSKYDDHVTITHFPEEFETEDFECISNKIQSVSVLVRQEPVEGKF